MTLNQIKNHGRATMRIEFYNKIKDKLEDELETYYGDNIVVEKMDGGIVRLQNSNNVKKYTDGNKLENRIVIEKMEDKMNDVLTEKGKVVMHRDIYNSLRDFHAFARVRAKLRNENLRITSKGNRVTVEHVRVSEIEVQANNISKYFNKNPHQLKVIVNNNVGDKKEFAEVCLRNGYYADTTNNELIVYNIPLYLTTIHRKFREKKPFSLTKRVVRLLKSSGTNIYTILGQYKDFKIDGLYGRKFKHTRESKNHIGFVLE